MPPRSDGDRPRPSPTHRATWHRRANAPVLFWLAALVVVLACRDRLPLSGWLAIHVVFLGAAGNAVMVWTEHFARSLLRGTAAGRRALAWRLVALNLGVLAVMAGMLASRWPPLLAGSILVGGAYAWHGTALTRRAHRALPSRFGASVRYYVAASWLIPVGAGLGALLAAGSVAGSSTPYYAEALSRLSLAHAVVNVFGFVGLTVCGTATTLLPAMLRTRVARGAERVLRWGWIPLLTGVLAAATGGAAGWEWLLAAGLAAYAGGLVGVLAPLARSARPRSAVEFPPLAVVAALGWLAVSVLVLLVVALASPGWQRAEATLAGLLPLLVVGFAAQVLVGALSYLLPVVLGGGPRVLKGRLRVLNQARWVRSLLLNAGVLLVVVPAPRIVPAVGGLAVVSALVWFLVLVAIVLWRRARPVAGSAPAPGA